jgi:hypothetical protein
MAKNCPT